MGPCKKFSPDKHPQLLNHSAPYDISRIHQRLHHLDAHLNPLSQYKAFFSHDSDPREAHPTGRQEVPRKKKRNRIEYSSNDQRPPLSPNHICTDHNIDLGNVC